MILQFPRNSTNWNISGTDTLRLGSRMLTTRFTTPKREGQCGDNLQNVEKSLRKVYIPDNGYKFLQEDQSGAEALIVAYLCRAGNFRDLFLYKIKPHCFVGLHVFKNEWKRELRDSPINIDSLCDCSIQTLTSHPDWKHVDRLIRSSDNWPAEKRFYYIAKQICHSSNYGVTPPMFQLNTLEKSRGKIVISKEAATEYLSIYHSLFPEIHEWHRDIERQLEATRTLYNLFGHPRFFWYAQKEPPKEVLKKAYAFVPQSTVGCITRAAFIDMQEFIETHDVDWHLLQDNHDSILMQIPEADELIAAKQLQVFINREFTGVDGTKFSMRSEAQSGWNWSSYDEKKNPQGLRELVWN